MANRQVLVKKELGVCIPQNLGSQRELDTRELLPRLPGSVKPNYVLQFEGGLVTRDSGRSGGKQLFPAGPPAFTWFGWDGLAGRLDGCPGLDKSDRRRAVAHQAPCGVHVWKNPCMPGQLPCR